MKTFPGEVGTGSEPVPDLIRESETRHHEEIESACGSIKNEAVQGVCLAFQNEVPFAGAIGLDGKVRIGIGHMILINAAGANLQN
jgi:hypothetical protein